MSVAVDVKGWCPGIVRPMPSGDGLIVRVRPRCGAIPLATAGALADLSERLGNGHIDLTRRANLQLRGLTEDRLSDLQGALGELGLIDADAETEAVRNVMVDPLAGLDSGQPVDVRPIAMAIEHALTADARLLALPAKFGFVVDGGGPLSIAAERADISLAAVGDVMAFGLDGEWLGTIVPERAAVVAVAAAHAFLHVAAGGRMRDLPATNLAAVHAAVAPHLSPIDRLPSPGQRRLGLLRGVVGIAAPFGRLQAGQLRRLVGLAAEAGAIDLRLSPWRTLYIGAQEGRLLLQWAREAGLIVDEGDPLLRVEACPGAPDCGASSVDTRGDARRLAAIAGAHGFKGSLHVSGCSKGCARSLASDLVLVGEAGGYRVIRKGTTRSPAERMIAPDRLATLFDG